MRLIVIIFFVAFANVATADMVLYYKADGKIEITWENASVSTNSIGVAGNRIRNINWNKYGVINADVPQGATNTNQCTNIKDAFDVQKDKDADFEGWTVREKALAKVLFIVLNKALVLDGKPTKDVAEFKEYLKAQM